MDSKKIYNTAFRLQEIEKMVDSIQSGEPFSVQFEGHNTARLTFNPVENTDENDFIDQLSAVLTEYKMKLVSKIIRTVRRSEQDERV